MSCTIAYLVTMLRLNLKQRYSILYKKTLTHLDMYHRGLSGRDSIKVRSHKILRVDFNATVEP